MCFPLILRTIKCFHVYIILDIPKRHRNASVLCQSKCACLHKTINMVVFFVKSYENTHPKGRALTQMYRVIPIRKKRELMRQNIKLNKWMTTQTYSITILCKPIFHGLSRSLLYTIYNIHLKQPSWVLCTN